MNLLSPTKKPSFTKEIIMGKKIYVGNLTFSVDDPALGNHFGQFGTVSSAKVITDRDTGRSKGFGFVEMSTDEEAQEAISKLDGTDFEGRTIRVNEAKEQGPRRRNFNQ